MPEAVMASMTSPEQGAQQECISTFLRLSGKASWGRLTSVMAKLAPQGGVVIIQQGPILVAYHCIPKLPYRHAFFFQLIAGYTRLFGPPQPHGVLLLAKQTGRASCRERGLQ